MYGGIEISTHELAILLSRNGVKTAVIAALNTKGKIYYQNRIISKLKREPFPADTCNGYPVFRGWISPVDVNEKVELVITKFRPTAIIVQATDAQLIATKLLERLIPIFVYIRDVEFDDSFGAFANSKPLAALPIRYIANSKYTASRFESRFGIQPTVLNPVVLPERYQTKISKEAILFINPTKVKGLGIALALAKLRPDIKFIFQESWPLGSTRQALLDAIKDLANVELCAPRSDMRTVYRRAKILLVPSQWDEAWGRVVTEAQINGIPVIASQKGGLPESVGAGGITLPPNADIKIWFEAVSLLWDDPVTWKEYSERALTNSKRQLATIDRLVDLTSKPSSSHFLLQRFQ